MAKKPRVTAAELDARLRSDPEWVRKDQERQARHDAKVAQLKAELEPEESQVRAELALLGCSINSVWDLVNTPKKYPDAVPVLVKYLPIARHPIMRQGPARALTVREARGIAGRTLLQELVSQKDPPGSQERWALANALTVTADKTLAEEIKTLVVDPSYKDVHERLNATLKKLRLEKRMA